MELLIKNSNNRFVTYKSRWILCYPSIYEMAWAQHVALCRMKVYPHDSLDPTVLDGRCCNCIYFAKEHFAKEINETNKTRYVINQEADLMWGK